MNNQEFDRQNRRERRFFLTCYFGVLVLYFVVLLVSGLWTP